MTGAGSISKGKEALLKALALYEISILKEERNSVFVGMDFVIEVEGRELYKLKQDGHVIAPFTDLEALCKMIKIG